VVKSHGAADATGVAAAVILAHNLAVSGFSDKLAKRVASLDGQAHHNQDTDRKPGSLT
jgi:glycerol-3-phosphate acyltransferase PlsX